MKNGNESWDVLGDSRKRYRGPWAEIGKYWPGKEPIRLQDSLLCPLKKKIKSVIKKKIIVLINSSAQRFWHCCFLQNAECSWPLSAAWNVGIFFFVPRSRLKVLTKVTLNAIVLEAHITCFISFNAMYLLPPSETMYFLIVNIDHRQYKTSHIPQLFLI